MNQAKANGGCVTSQFQLSESTLPELVSLLTAESFVCTRCRLSLAIEFEDGFDALFVSIVSGKPTNPPSDTSEDVFREFKLLNERRNAVLMGLRHHAANNETALIENADGSWDFQSEGGAWTSGFYVGPVLTRLVMKHEPATALCQLLERAWLPKLTSDEATRLVLLAEQPSKPAKWKSADEITPLFGSKILSFDCKALEGSEPWPKDPESLANLVAPTRNSPGQLVVDQLVERVGRHRFSYDLCSKGEAHVDFTDKNDFFIVRPRSRSLARAVERDGLAATVNRLANEFQALDQARATALRLVEQAMAMNGFALDDILGPWWFGKSHRAAEFKIDRALTLGLSKHKPEALVHQWLVPTNLLAEVPSPEALLALTSGPIVRAKRKSLPKHEAIAETRLPHLATLDVAKLDLQAQQAIQTALNQANADPGVSRIADYHDLLQLWSQNFWYRRSDTWISFEQLNAYAKAAWKRHERDDAAVFLLVHGDETPRSAILERINRYDYWESEAFYDELLWVFVNELPWPIDEGEYPKFPPVLNPPPPQVTRRAAMALRQAIGELDKTSDEETKDVNRRRAIEHAALLDHTAASEWLTYGEIERLKLLLFGWASQSDDYCTLRTDEPFIVAAAFGLTELTDILANNPDFANAQFDMEEISFTPGEVALHISWVRPCELAARFAACAMIDQPAELLEQRAGRLAGSSKYIEMSREMINESMQRDRFAAAIAWTRCRCARVV
jgi:hypothetical protein